VPSHGTDILGQRYAYDFVRAVPGVKGLRLSRHSLPSYLLRGVRLRDCFGWGEPIFSATSGVVIEAHDGWPERDPVHPARDFAVALRNGIGFDLAKVTDLRPLSGNHVIVESDCGYLVYAHAATGSVSVRPGDRVEPGRVIAAVGHSGNSTGPHLHFQLMDGPDPRTAGGVLCCFREYEVLDRGVWITVRSGIPKRTERLRLP
jgi:murein DD-endopeptidase MepM/ murein hydrolase activator NlpD